MEKSFFFFIKSRELFYGSSSVILFAYYIDLTRNKEKKL